MSGAPSEKFSPLMDTEDELIEEYEVDGGDILPQIVSTIAAALVMFGFGLSEGYSSPALDSMESFIFPNRTLAIKLNGSESSVDLLESFEVHNMHLSSLSGKKIAPISGDEASWIGSLLFAGAFVGSLFSGVILNYGRKMALLCGSLPRLASWFIIAFAPSLGYIYCGRFISGLSTGLLMTACPLYVSEIASPKIRGSLITSMNVFTNLGILVAFVFGKYLEWQYLALVCGLINLFSLIPMMMIPESPLFLLYRGREKDARDSLQRLRGAVSIEREFNMMHQMQKRRSSMESRGFCEELKGLGSIQIVVPVLILLFFIVIHKFCGYYPIITYTVQFLHNVPTVMSEHDTAILIGVIQLFASLLPVFVIDKGGRKLMGIVSTSFLTLFFFVMGIEIYLFSHGFAVPSVFVWSGFMSLIGIVFMFCSGLGPLKLVLLGEILPKEHRQLTSAIVGSFMWISLFASVKLFFSMVAAMHLFGVCWFYSGVCLVGAVFIRCCLPETKGKSIHQLDNAFIKKKKDLQTFGTFPRQETDNR